MADKKGFRAKIKTNEPGTGSIGMKKLITEFLIRTRMNYLCVKINIIDAADAIYNGPDPHGHSKTHIPSGWGGGHHHEHHHPQPHHGYEHEHHEGGEHEYHP